MSKSELCRLCAKLTDVDYAQSLFEREQRKLLQQVKDFTGLQLLNAKDLPQYICIPCKAQTMQAYEFRERCIRAQEYFKTADFQFSNKEESSKYTIAQYDDNITDEEWVCQEQLEEGGQCIMESETSSFVDEIPMLIKNELQAKGKQHRNPKPRKKSHPIKLTEIKTNASIEKKKFICDQCGEQFDISSKFTYHMIRHSGNKKHPCTLCEKSYYTKTDLTHHMYTHTGELPYSCEFCDRRFNSRSHLIRHRRTHTNERPFVCNYCGKAFTSSNIHKSHLLTHTGVRAFDCLLCNVSFKRKTNLVSHNRSKSHKRNEENQQNLDRYAQST